MIVQRIKSCCGFMWQMGRTFFQLLRGVWKISRMPGDRVSIFGGARFVHNDIYFKKAHQLGERLVEHNISVVTGGGPGVMQAISCGAAHMRNRKASIIGIGVKGIEDRNLCVEEYMEFDHFFARKWLLMHYSKAFIIFPGGFGTLDEFAEVLLLIQVKQLARSPIVLFGVEYWRLLMQWIEDEILAHGLISRDDLDLLYITDDMDEIFRLICQHCKALP